MSVRQITQVFDHSKSTGVTRLVLLALADVASDDGEVAAYKRSQRILQRKANCGERSVQRALDTLEALGEIRIIRRGDGRRSTDYQITLGESPQNEGGQDDTPDPSEWHPRGVTTTPQGCQDDTPIIPSLFVITPSSPDVADSTKREVPDRFDEFWSVYPRREGKGAARTAWGKATRKADPQTLIDAAVRYRKLKRDPQYTKLPATWLNHECWEDELPTAPDPLQPNNGTCSLEPDNGICW